MPEAYGTEKHLIRAFQMIDEFKPNHIIVDSISSFERMGSSRAAFEFAMRLVSHCKDKGITIILVNQSIGSAEDRQAISGLGISSLIDAILWLRFLEEKNRLKRVLLVIKSRGSNHSTQYRDFQITDNGIKLSAESPDNRPAIPGRAKK
jgi:circadian clock protein KaiC